MITIGSGTQVSIRKLPSFVYSHVFLSGDLDGLQLLNLAIELMEMDLLDVFPKGHKINPYYEDPEFMEAIKPFCKVYVKQINQENYKQGLEDIVRYFRDKGSDEAFIEELLEQKKPEKEK
ncbi:MAG TPA: hypothetical protein VEA58_06575 [Anaerovoracaceae bacterium]|nr:hypothetical protein [Anaerovoracaceae bacterium]